MKFQSIFLSVLLLASCQMNTSDKKNIIGKNTEIIQNDLMTPEVLWAMGRIGNFTISPDGKQAVYGVSYYSVPQNKSHKVLYTMNMDTRETKQLTETVANEFDAVYFKEGKKILFLSTEGESCQLWSMNADGSGHKQITKLEKDIDGFLLSPDENKIILVQQIDDYTNIAKKYDDLPEATGMVINDLMYKHWDSFVTTIPHPFVADFNENGVGELKDILEGEPYECPMLPFGGVEQLNWSTDSKLIAYSCKKKSGSDYAVSTDADIYLYDIAAGTTRNLCKQEGYQEPQVIKTQSFKDQKINQGEQDNNMGYDTNPQFSPDGKYISWLSMERDGYESDRNRLCIYEFATGMKNYVSEDFQSGVDTYCWAKTSDKLYFSGVWHGTSMCYSTNLDGNVEQLTSDVCDYSVVELSADGNSLITKRQSMKQADEVYAISLLEKNKIDQLTHENQYFYDNLAMGDIEEKWIPTIDGKQELCWVIYPPHFDKNKKYPTLLFCEGGPQSPVSQFWSYRWNFQIMAANGYIIIAPNRRGLPGFGMEWLEEISGDYNGLCMSDYLSAIDYMAEQPYVDKDRLGCVGASFGGYSVYWLAGHHEGRFKCFIAHDGIYNTEQQYTETEEMWFPNWDLKGAPWEIKDNPAYLDSPHRSIDKWDTPILCIHGMKDYRILHSQAQAAFDAAKMRGIDAQLLLFPDENHCVLHPQNGVLWQRTFFAWLDKWLK